jgi:hypothetical protein
LRFCQKISSDFLDFSSNEKIKPSKYCPNSFLTASPKTSCISETRYIEYLSLNVCNHSKKFMSNVGTSLQASSKSSWE